MISGRCRAAGGALGAAVLLGFPPAAAGVVAGDLDSSFGNSGTVLTVPGANGGAYSDNAVAVQGDGKIVVGGSAATGDNGVAQRRDLALARYLPDGSRDTSFGASGIVTTPILDGGDVSALALEPDGRLVAVGWATRVSTNSIVVLRYLADGSLDTSFGQGGVVTTQILAGSSAKAVVVQPDGHILVAGGATDPASSYMTVLALARYDAAGALDPTFGTGGILTEPGFDAAGGVALQPGGKIAVGTGPSVVRYLPDGARDTTFGTNGVATANVPGGGAVALTPSGEIETTGPVGVSPSELYVARFTTDGRLDQAFGTGGVVRIPPRQAANPLHLPANAGTALLVEADGKTVVAGWNDDGAGSCARSLLVRVLADGSLDPTFGGSGEALAEIGACFAGSPRALAQQADGKYVTTGSASGNGLGWFATMRWLAEATPDAPPPADTRAPVTTITGGPSATVTESSATFAFVADEAGATFECALDSAPWVTCASPQQYLGLQPGSHTFAVRATDAAGNVEPVPASRTWTYAAPADTTPPETTITGGPSGTVAEGTATFSFTSSEPGSSFECAVDSGPWTACTSAQSYGGLAPGKHGFAVRAIDAAGNVDPTPALQAWTIAASPPPNDSFAAAQTIVGRSGSTAGTTAGATREPGEPDHAGDRGGHSVWYRWTAPARGAVTFTTAGSSFDTLLAAYRGASVSALTVVAANDDAGVGTLTSRVRFTARAGVTYSIAVDGYAGASGAVVVNWQTG